MDPRLRGDDATNGWVRYGERAMNQMPKAPVVITDADALCSRPADGEARLADGTTERVSWQLPEEVAVALQFNSEPYTVMMATPADLRDFAIGFVLAEGLIANVSDIKGVLVMPVENGITVDVAVDESAINPARLVRRSVEGRSGCGLCGVEDIASAIRPLAPIARSQAPTTQAILKAAKALPGKQPMNRLNRTVHGAAWVAHDGEILIVREDVGRHSALDKLIGALAQAQTDPASGFVLMTSRCSFELVQKSVTFGIGALVTVSAPTALARDLAEKSNLFLAALGAGGAVVFNP
jgi:FdhD protein